MNIRELHHMLRKSLLAGIALINLNTIEASQNTPPLHAQQPAHHPQTPAHHDKTQHEPAHHTKDAKHCPCGGVGGWVLIPAGPGTPCNQNAAEEEEKPHHKPAGEHHVTPHKPSHPLPTPAEEALAAQLKPIQAHIFKRADPNHPNAEKRGEWGKALNDKVYFKTLGIWKHDPSVHATTDIIATGVKDKIKMFNQTSQNPQHSQTPTPKPVRKSTPAAAEVPADIPDGPTTAAPTNVAPPPPPSPASTGGKPPAKRWPKVNVPDALGTTQGRVQSATTNPTKGNELEFGLGAPNRAQTGVTGKPIPEADSSASKPAVPSPSTVTAELDQ
jgi:hypothetical protein